MMEIHQYTHALPHVMCVYCRHVPAGEIGNRRSRGQSQFWEVSPYLWRDQMAAASFQPVRSATTWCTAAHLVTVPRDLVSLTWRWTLLHGWTVDRHARVSSATSDTTRSSWPPVSLWQCLVSVRCRVTLPCRYCWIDVDRDESVFSVREKRIPLRVLRVGTCVFTRWRESVWPSRLEFWEVFES